MAKRIKVSAADQCGPKPLPAQRFSVRLEGPDQASSRGWTHGHIKPTGRIGANPRDAAQPSRTRRSGTGRTVDTELVA